MQPTFSVGGTAYPIAFTARMIDSFETEYQDTSYFFEVTKIIEQYNRTQYFPVSRFGKLVKHAIIAAGGPRFSDDDITAAIVSDLIGASAAFGAMVGTLPSVPDDEKNSEGPLPEATKSPNG